MDSQLAVAASGLTLVGTLILLVADAWFSRSVLVYLDALESKLIEIIGVLQQGGKDFENAGIDLHRDRGQNRARLAKLVGWLFLAAGFALQMITLTQRAV